MLSVVNDEGAVADGRSMLDEICREGARRCSPRRSRPRSTRMSPSSSVNATRTAIGS